ncbi:diphthine methyltransferase [Hetaerina americana]|uniref:diphthine methyltransferase n=1 Tax=Hetaerina americana TaxID=62018 RepID=UPI003A7F4D6C
MFGALTLDSKVMKYSADCVEWCPINAFHDIFACGTYQLMNGKQEAVEKSPQTVSRLGNINLFRVGEGGLLVLQQCLETPGVLDMKWCNEKNSLDEPILAVANAEGAVMLFYLRKKGDTVELVQGESIICVEKKGTLALSIDWCVGNGGSSKLVVSDSDGSVSILRFTESGLEKEHNWNSHSHEAWISIFDNKDPNIVYSGGDDCQLAMYDLRQKCQIINLKKEHNAGVTALSCYMKHNILASGSYDEILRLWDKRNWKAPLSEINLGGGVWKIKWCPKSDEEMQNYLLVACMHAGFKLIDCTKAWEGKSMIESLTYSDHDSLAYGCDWSHSQSLLQHVSNNDVKGINFRSLIASCSFYDSKLCLWAV